MKLSQYAKKIGVTYKTAYRWYRAGTLDASQTETGIIIVREKADEKPLTGRIALYARTSMAARISGRRQSKRRAEKIKQCVEQVMKEEE